MAGRKVFIFTMVAFLLVTLLLIPGCNPQRVRWEVSYEPKVVGDGVGGVISLYDVMKSKSQRDFYVQRIDSDGQRQWGERGTLVGSVSMETVSFVYMKIVNDGYSGAIITRGDLAYDLSTRTYQITRVGPDGEILWQKPVNAAHQLVSDEDGGAIVASVDGSKLLVNKFDSEGNLPWGENGLSIELPQYERDSLKAIGDGIGGVILSWREAPGEPPPGTDTSKPWKQQTILAQRIDAKGNILWGEGGVVLYVSPKDTAGSWQNVVADGLGGAYVSWNLQFIGDSTGGKSPNDQMRGAYVQKLDAEGSILWQPETMGLKIAEDVFQEAPMVFSDGSGGAFAIWHDLRGGEPAQYVQRISPEEISEWQAGGVKTFYLDPADPYYPGVTGEGNGGLFTSISFKDPPGRIQGIRLMRLDADGSITWQIDPLRITVDVTLARQYVISDGQGGVILAWSTRETELSNSQASYVQRIGSDGQLLWGGDGIRLD